jgi:hypothetical protein
MAAKTCYHCKQIVTDPKTHDCWTTTEEKLTRDLPEDLFDAWERLRETATTFGEQRIYASHRSIMFSRKTCYFFVRPKKHVLEVCFFLGRKVRDSRIRRCDATSAVKAAHLLHIKHRDEVETPITDWLREAYDINEELGRTPRRKPEPSRRARKRPAKAAASRSRRTASRRATGKARTSLRAG